ncbi:leucine-rich repeat protein, partial [Trabulsiella guamensis ATCC 49490]
AIINKLIRILDRNCIKYTIADNGSITVGGRLYLSGTSITALPDNLTVGGSLDLRGTGITALPDNLTVGGSLDLRGTGI